MKQPEQEDMKMISAENEMNGEMEIQEDYYQDEKKVLAIEEINLSSEYTKDKDQIQKLVEVFDNVECMSEKLNNQEVDSVKREVPELSQILFKDTDSVVVEKDNRQDNFVKSDQEAHNLVMKEDIRSFQKESSNKRDEELQKVQRGKLFWNKLTGFKNRYRSKSSKS